MTLRFVRRPIERLFARGLAIATAGSSVLAIVLSTPLFASAAAGRGGDGSQHVMDGPDVPPQLVEQVRQATAQFLDVQQAIAAGYGAFLGCVSGPQEGAMGVHFVNPGLVGDGELDVNRPEALIYEPGNGELRLVGVEYVVTVADWQKHHPDDGPAAPVLGGQVLQFNDSPNRYGLPPFYELHVWAWRNNPHGAFVDWNTLVKCGQ